jgi:hypothetical protein
MFVIVLAAFIGAVLANFRAEATEFFGFVTPQAHKLGRSITKCGAFHIELDAFGHHFYILFLSAGRSAMITDRGA